MPLLTVTALDEPTLLAELCTIALPDAERFLDPTYGMGRFYAKGVPTCAGDRLYVRAPHVQLDYTALPFQDDAFDAVIFDPPFQPATVQGVIGTQYTKIAGGVAGVEASVRAGLLECERVARIGMIVKVQDYIHDHRPVWMSRWVWDTLGDPYDFAIRTVPTKLKASNWGRQLSVYRNHSTFWVYRWKSIR